VECTHYVTPHNTDDWVVVALGVPWLLKLLHLPLTVYAQRRIKRDEPHITETLERMQDLQNRFSHDETRLRAEMGALLKERGNPVKAQFLPILAPLSLVPFQISLFLAFRTMHEQFPSWHFEGWWWFRDLSLADPTWTLPLAAGFLTAGHMMVVSKSIPDRKFASTMQAVCMVMAGATIPIMNVFGAGFCLYCLSNTVANMAQSSILRNPTFRKRMRLKPNPVIAQTEKEKTADKIIHYALGMQLIAVGLLLYMAKDVLTPTDNSSKMAKDVLRPTDNSSKESIVEELTE